MKAIKPSTLKTKKPIPKTKKISSQTVKSSVFSKLPTSRLPNATPSLTSKEKQINNQISTTNNNILIGSIVVIFFIGLIIAANSRFIWQKIRQRKAEKSEESPTPPTPSTPLTPLTPGLRGRNINREEIRREITRN